MVATPKNSDLPKKDDRGSEQLPPAPVPDDDIEDGDMATPKQDGGDDDDQPL